MKHASALAANPNVNEEQAKQIYKSLRKAAGLFKFVQEKYFEKLPDQPAKGSDLDPRVSTAYQMQCLAEAQEGKILIFNLFFFWSIGFHREDPNLQEPFFVALYD